MVVEDGEDKRNIGVVLFDYIGEYVGIRHAFHCLMSSALQLIMKTYTCWT
jgi:hypothetical protein